MTFPKKVINSDAGDADHFGGNDIDDLTDQVTNLGFAAYSYLVYKDGSNFKAKNGITGVIDSTNTSALTVIQYAIDNTASKAPIILIGEKGKWFNLTGQVNLVDRHVKIFGVSMSPPTTSAVENSANDYGGVVIRKNYATAEPLFNCVNTVFTHQQFANLGIVGSNVAGDTGIKATFVTERSPFLNNVHIRGFGTGLDLINCHYVDFNQLVIDKCTTGLRLNGTGNADNNTQKYFGGRISSNTVNLLVDYCNDIKFFGTVFESDVTTGSVKAVDNSTNHGANDMAFYSCSFEYTPSDGGTIIYDNGNNNLYYNCRFASASTTFTPFRIGTNAKNINIVGNFFQQGVGQTQTIQVDSGAVNTHILFNLKSTNSVGTITLTDSGTTTMVWGNMGIPNKLPDAQQLDNYLDIGRMSAPANPATNYGRFYVKQEDANNDSLYMKIKKAGAFTEVKIA